MTSEQQQKTVVAVETNRGSHGLYGHCDGVADGLEAFCRIG